MMSTLSFLSTFLFTLHYGICEPSQFRYTVSERFFCLLSAYCSSTATK